MKHINEPAPRVSARAARRAAAARRRDRDRAREGPRRALRAHGRLPRASSRRASPRCRPASRSRPASTARSRSCCRRRRSAPPRRAARRLAAAAAPARARAARRASAGVGCDDAGRRRRRLGRADGDGGRRRRPAPICAPGRRRPTIRDGGDGRSTTTEAPLATDGDQATYWPTETLHERARASGKAGVGLVLDAGEARSASTADGDDRHAGLHGADQGGRRADGPVPRRLGLADRRARGRRSSSTAPTARYFVVWITSLARRRVGARERGHRLLDSRGLVAASFAWGLLAASSLVIGAVVALLVPHPPRARSG